MTNEQYLQIIGRVISLIFCVSLWLLFRSPVWWVLIGLNIVAIIVWLIPEPESK